MPHGLSDSVNHVEVYPGTAERLPMILYRSLLGWLAVVPAGEQSCMLCVLCTSHEPCF
jgi:hypothetical protein